MAAYPISNAMIRHLLLDTKGVSWSILLLMGWSRHESGTA
jgi:hypothetical protein